MDEHKKNFLKSVYSVYLLFIMEWLFIFCIESSRA